MVTLDEMVEAGTGIQLLPNTFLYPVTDMDTVSKHCSGEITYKVNGGSGYRQQRFYLTVDGELHSSLVWREVDFIVSLGNLFEKLFKASGMMVIEISLPMSHGYCGRSYGYYSTKRLFSSAGVKGFTI